MPRFCESVKVYGAYTIVARTAQPVDVCRPTLG